MKLSTKGRYGLKAMYYLAKDNSANNISCASLSKLTNISPTYLEKLIAILKKNKLVMASRGATGGYMLAREPKSITIGEILRCLEGKLYLADCNAGKCNNENCPNKTIFNVIYLKINKVLDNLTLDDMIRGNYE